MYDSSHSYHGVHAHLRDEGGQQYHPLNRFILREVLAGRRRRAGAAVDEEWSREGIIFATVVDSSSKSVRCR